ncbi:MAG: NTP/NDP exchange transporter [Candidatus Cardinium sp.]|nr:NTP/NDP exchange transporter [Candidatus Cardinium sp.]
MSSKQEFGTVRGLLWPIHGHELRKFFPMAFIFLLISFCYALTRSLKDMNMLSGVSATTMYFLKGLGVMPSMILFTLIYGKVSRAMDRDGRFNVVMIYFLVFFFFALTYLLPKKELLQLQFSETFQAQYPRLRGVWEMLTHWPICLFYVHAEAWGTFAISVVFWTLANEITAINQAKRFYSFLIIFAAMGSIVAGLVLKLESVRANFDQGLKFVIGAIFLILIVYKYFSTAIKANPTYYQVEKKPKKTKVKMSFMESIRFLARSKYLMLISVLVIGYGLVIALFEGVLKSQMQKYVVTTGDKSLYSVFYADQQIAVGLVSILFTFFFARPILNRGWTFAASTTPVAALGMTFLFFTFLCFGDFLDKFLQKFHITALYMSVLVGIYNVVFVKSVKYVLFDPTKEAVYIPLDEETKVRGKAAVDGVGSRLGKTLASYLIMGMSALFGGGDIANIRMPIVLMIIVVIMIWLTAVKALGKLKAEAEVQHEAERAKE